MKNLTRLLPANKITAPNRIIQSFCLIIAIFYPVSGLVADKDGSEQTKVLESVRNQIEEAKSNLDLAKTESDQLQEELRIIEIAIGKETQKLKGLEEQIQKRYERLNQLNNIIVAHERSLANEQQYLSSQLRSAYMNGRSDYLKLLLNQEDPAKVGRVLAYYDYYIKARTRSINLIRDKVNLVDELRASIQSETDLLEQLKQRQFIKKEELLAYRESRNTILERLQDDIKSKGQELESLKEHERKLTMLLDKLDRSRDATTAFDDTTPFGSLKGRLEWPARGKLQVKYGSQRRKGTSLKWQGVKIAANAGEEVHAVHNGKVIFADWFRNLGLLVIIDHGNGYMSLYGYNQDLLKKPGDWVLAGEPIAHVGDSGGQLIPGLYFEIRHQGKPLNPTLWCRK
jgi:murein hydrolase activator